MSKKNTTPEHRNSAQAAKEYVIALPERNEVRCVCGNISSLEGFAQCNEEGRQIEETPGPFNLYLCLRCGRIIMDATLEVVGRNASKLLS